MGPEIYFPANWINYLYGFAYIDERLSINKG